MSITPYANNIATPLEGGSALANFPYEELRWPYRGYPQWPFDFPLAQEIPYYLPGTAPRFLYPLNMQPQLPPLSLSLPLNQADLYPPVPWELVSALPLAHASVPDEAQESCSGSGHPVTEPRRRRSRARKIIEGGVSMHASFSTTTSTDNWSADH
jgi:hypothetical protein